MDKQPCTLSLDPCVVLAAELVAVNLGHDSLSAMVQQLLVGAIARYRADLERDNREQWGVNYEAVMAYLRTDRAASP